MALQQMSYLVIPIAQNLIASQTLLDDDKLTKPTGNPDDDKKLRRSRQLLETIAFQSASLDIINGFVATQQMGELQHAGEEYLGAIQGSDMTTTSLNRRPTLGKTQYAGSAAESVCFDLTTVPGLALGYNPLSKIMEGLQWLRSETQKREDAAGKTIKWCLTNAENNPTALTVHMPSSRRWARPSSRAPTAPGRASSTRSRIAPIRISPLATRQIKPNLWTRTALHLEAAGAERATIMATLADKGTITVDDRAPAERWRAHRQDQRAR